MKRRANPRFRRPAQKAAQAGEFKCWAHESRRVDPKRFPQLLKTIYEAVDELEVMFPGRHFTPDGHMVGSLGEALANYYYGIELASASAYCHDGTCDGKQVQVKATQGKRISLSSEPEHLLVLSLSRAGLIEEKYNGPGAHVWRTVAHKPHPKNGQYQVTLSALTKLMRDVPEDQKLKRRNA